MSTFHAVQGKGAKAKHLQRRRDRAQAREALALPQPCGHKHVPGREAVCADAVAMCPCGFKAWAFTPVPESHHDDVREHFEMCEVGA